MRLYSVTVLADAAKFEMAPFFFKEVLGLPVPLEMSPQVFRFYDAPPFLAIQQAPESDEEGSLAGGFTGIQFNVVPAKDLNPIVAKLRASGLNQPAPRELEGSRLMWAQDASKNVFMIVGTDEPPDEPVVEHGIGSISLFVSDIARARAFWCDTLHLTVRAEPHDGLLVLDPGTATAITVYQVPPDQPSMPIGRTTGLGFSTGDVGTIIAAVEGGGGAVLDWVGEGKVAAATMADPDGNTFTVLDAARIVEPTPLDEAGETPPDAGEAPN